MAASSVVSRLRTARDLLARVPKLTATQPYILDAGCGDGTASSKMLIEQYPAARMLCIDASAKALDAAKAEKMLKSRSLVAFACEDMETHFTLPAPGGSMFDLVFSSGSMHFCADPASILTAVMARLRPSGTLALQIPDTRNMPSHALLRETASEFGVPGEVRIPTNEHEPHEFARWLDGPLCAAASLDMWTTTYVERLQGPDAVFEHVRGTAEFAPVAEVLGGTGSEAYSAFESTYRERLAKTYSSSSDGTTLFQSTRFFLVAKRPSLMDVYGEYAAYHDHQLTKGWKS